MNKQQGFIQLILLIIVIIVLGGGTWFVYKSYIQPNKDNPFQAITTLVQNIVKQQPTSNQTANVSPATPSTTLPTTTSKTGYSGNNCHPKSPTDHSIVCGY